ncbi:DUF3102 domain-containing protein [Myxosarcina sp. GI1(2024)]
MASNHPSSRPSEIDLSQRQRFDYGNLDSETKISVEQHALEIKSLIRQTAQDIVSIGQKLTEVKRKLKHGNFRNWLRTEFNWSMSSATKLMQVSEQFKDVNFANLNFSTSALYILAAPSTPKEARQQALKLASHGEQITYSLAKVIVNRYKDIYSVREPELDRQSQTKMDSKHQSSIQTINVAAQAIADETVEERDPFQEKQNNSLIEDVDTRPEKGNDGLRNFKITYAGISFMIQGKPEEITALFEQMQSNPNFAREIFAKAIFAKAKLLLNSDIKSL